MPEPHKAEIEQRATMVAQTFDGIQPTFEAFYIHSILHSARCAVAAFERFDSARANGHSAVMQVSAIHEALIHAAALSRFFWPGASGRGRGASQQKLTTGRASRLRVAFEMEDGNVLAARGLRNALEHFDERLDDFLIGDRWGYFFPDSLVGDCRAGSEVRTSIFKLVDPDESCFVLLGQRYDYGAVRSEIDRIHALAAALAASGGRLCRRAPQRDP